MTTISDSMDDLWSSVGEEWDVVVLDYEEKE